MTHNEKRTHWVKEGTISLGTGVLYGVTVVGSAHPFDTIKTKMQAQAGFENTNMFKTFIKVFKSDGLKGLYRGCVPPLWGSGIYRSVQFSAFEATYTYLNNDFGKIAVSDDIEIRVILAGIMAGTVRSIVECPLDFAKINRQMNKNWRLKNCYTGFVITWTRACILLPTYFITFDLFRRKFDDSFRNKMYGPFLASGTASVLGWWACWPLEVIKTHIQSGEFKQRKMNWLDRFKFIISERGGFIGLFRGICPGSVRSFIGNGLGMVVMQFAQKKVTQLGLRD